MTAGPNSEEPDSDLGTPADDELIVDISIGDPVGDPAGGSSTRQSRVVERQRRAGESASPPRRVLAVVGALAVLAVALIGLLAGGDDIAAPDPEPTPTPAPTATPSIEPDTGRGQTEPNLVADPGRPSLTAQRIPVVSDGMSRAGEQCRLPAGDVDVVFTVPDGRTMFNCQLMALSPSAHMPEEAIATVALLNRFSFREMRSERVGRGLEVQAAWAPVGELPGYALSLADSESTVRMQVVEIDDWWSLLVQGPIGRGQPDVLASIDALLASVRVEAPGRTPEPRAEAGGRCANERIVVDVPAGWFADSACFLFGPSHDLLDTPLWVDVFESAKAADLLALEQIRIDSTAKTDGVEIIDATQTQPALETRRARYAIIELDGSDDVAVVRAWEGRDSVLSLLDWDQVVLAHEAIVAGLRAHSDPGCATDARFLVARSEQPTVPFERVGDVSEELPSGTLVEATGCERVGLRGTQLEIIVDADRSTIGWVHEEFLATPEIELCPSGEGTFDPTGWDFEVEGDFDGDGRPDRAFLANREPSTDERPPPNAAVLFANGGYWLDSLTIGVGLRQLTPEVAHPPQVERFVGVGRDLLGVRHGGEPVTYALFDLNGCDPVGEPIVELRNFGRGVSRQGWCRGQVDGMPAIREWQESSSIAGWYGELDQTWIANPAARPGAGPGDRALMAIQGEMPCGPEVIDLPVTVEAGLPGTELAGEHVLSLQWINAADDSVGSIEFEPLGDDRYRSSGQHVDRRGSELFVAGVFERISADEFAFDGLVQSRVARLNDGAPCVRDAGQVFVRRPGTDTFRMQDRINCDGARTDWIDLTLTPN